MLEVSFVIVQCFCVIVSIPGHSTPAPVALRLV